MNDPFAYEPRQAPDAGPPSEPGRVSVPCIHCDTKLARQQYDPFAWTHVDDEITMRGTLVISDSNYDHKPEPRVIDVEVIS